MAAAEDEDDKNSASASHYIMQGTINITIIVTKVVTEKAHAIA